MIRKVPKQNAPVQGEPKTPPEPADPQALLTPDQAASRLGVKAAVLERWRGTGDGPKYIRLSKKSLRYRPADLDAFIESRVTSSTADI